MAHEPEVFINLPAADLDRSEAFFRALGFEFVDECSEETARWMKISSRTHAMLLSRSYFEGFIPGKAIVDSNVSAEVLIALSLADRSAVDAMIEKAIAAGGSEYREATDAAWVYYRAFQDLDGHVWEVMAVNEDEMSGEKKEESV